MASLETALLDISNDNMLKPVPHIDRIGYNMFVT